MTRETTREESRNPSEALDPLQAAADHGIDITQLRDNLALPVVELLQKAKRLPRVMRRA